MDKYFFKLKDVAYKLVKKSPFFDERWYLKQNPDVLQTKVNPAWHYLHYGWKEGRNPSALFDTKQYLAKYPECKICPLVFEYNRNAFVDLSIVAIMRNEAPYVKEWIDYHRLVGVSRFYIYDNESTDNLKEILFPYIEQGIVVYKYFPGEKADGIQSLSYKDCISLYKDCTKWLAIIDADEFIVPVKKKTIPAFLKEYEKYPGVVINWIMYDSNGHKNKPTGGLMENYTRVHYSHECHDDTRIKSIVNPRKVQYPGEHCCIYYDNKLAVNERFTPNPYGESVVQQSYKKIRINHYWTKSYGEFMKKIRKPRCNGKPLVVTEKNYNFPDYKYDYIMWKYVVKLHKSGFWKEYLKFLRLQCVNIWLWLKHIKKWKKKNFVHSRWYCKQYPDVKKSGLTAQEHYDFIGWKKGYNPSPKFNTNAYLKMYPDIKKANINPLEHYINFGKNEGRIVVKAFCEKRPDLWDKLVCLFKKKNPKVSVIVASYNYADLIRDTLDSLLAQTYKNFEIIVVDDGSKDNSVAVIKEYVKKYDNVFLYQHDGGVNKGLPETIKLALKYATGEYVAFCESDDIWFPSYLEEKIKYINTYASPKIIANDIELFGNVSEHYTHYLDCSIHALSSNINKIDIFAMSSNVIPTFSSVMIDRKVLEKCDFNSFIPAWLDFWIYRQILVKYPLFYVNKPLTKWRLHNSFNSPDKSQEYSKKLDDFLFFNTDLIIGQNAKLARRLLRNSDLKIQYKSKFFDSSWYCKHYPEVKQFHVPPVYHYHLLGWKRGYNPSALFHTNAYFSLHFDIKSIQMNPLLHYLRYGKSERRNILPAQCEPKIYGNMAAGKEKVLLVSHLLNHTGAPFLLWQVAKVLIEEGDAVLVLSPQDGDLRKSFLDIGAMVVIDPLACIQEENCNYLINYNFKFCICNTMLSALAYSFLSKRIPSIWWIHENVSPQEAKTCEEILRNAAHICVPSKLTYSYIAPYNSKCEILSYPVKDMLSGKLPTKDFRYPIKFALYGTLSHRKGQDRLLRALQILPKDIRSKGSFELVGEHLSPDFYNNELKPLSKNIKEVKYRGVIKDQIKYHQSFENIDVLCCPSREDPCPLVVIDALMHGCPVILSDHVGQKDIIENGKNGYVFSTEEDLTVILMEILNNPEKLVQMSVAARETFLKHFDYDACTANLKKLMVEVCKKS